MPGVVIPPYPTRFYLIVESLTSSYSIAPMMHKLKGRWVKISCKQLSYTVESNRTGGLGGFVTLKNINALNQIGEHRNVLHVLGGALTASGVTNYVFSDEGFEETHILIDRNDLVANGGEIQLELDVDAYSPAGTVTLTTRVFSAVLQFEDVHEW